MQCHLAVGLLKSSEVRIEEISKMLADIFKDPLVDCLCKVNASMLLASNSTADRTRKNIIVTRKLSIRICHVYGNDESFSTCKLPVLFMQFFEKGTVGKNVSIIYGIQSAHILERKITSRLHTREK